MAIGTLRAVSALVTMRVSYTQLDTYKQCPRKYKFYIDKAPQDPSRTVALRFGSAVHKALEFAYAKRFKNPPVERVLNYFRKMMAEEIEPEALELFAKGIPALEKYLTENDAKNFRIVEVEQKFSMPLTQAHEMVGVVDRLDMLPDGSFEIIDFKTGKIPDARKMGENWQLAIYQMVKQEALQTNRITVSLVYVMYDGHKLTYQFSQDELDRIRSEIVAQITTMERDETFPTRTGWWCDTCAYQPICPAWTHKPQQQGVVTGKEHEKELLDVQAKVDRLLQVMAASRRLRQEADALKEALAVYAKERNLTRLFSDLGTVSIAFRKKSAYDIAGLAEVLRADLLRKIVKTVDVAKLERALPYLSEDERTQVESLRRETEQTIVTPRPQTDEGTEELLTP